MKQNGSSAQAGAAGPQRTVAETRNPLEILDSIALMVRCRRGQEICSQGNQMDYWYRVVSGAARRCVVLPTGRRQIVDLLLPGDFFGAADRNEHAFALEAIVESTVVACYPRRQVERLADADPRVARQIREMTFNAILRLEEQLLIVGHMTAVEKVGSFILTMAERLSGESADSLYLPMSRYDIAAYLAVSVETVSRALTGLRLRGAITFAGTRQIRIVDRDALADGHAYGEDEDRSKANGAHRDAYVIGRQGGWRGGRGEYRARNA